MLLTEHSHHRAKGRIIEERIDRHGQIRVTRGLGFDLANAALYEEICKAEIVRRQWLERWDGTATVPVWEDSKRPHLQMTRDELVKFRDVAYKDCTVVVWEGNLNGEGRRVFVDLPKGTPLPACATSRNRRVFGKKKQRKWKKK
jgi:hypothetical protein